VSLAALLTVAFTAIPVPFALEYPGPWWNTLGNQSVFDDCSPNPTEDGTEPLIEISGTTTYPTTGALDLLTVCLQGTPEYMPNWFDVMQAYLSPSQSVIPFEFVYPKNQTQEERDESNAAEMVDSQGESIAAAMTYLGFTLETAAVVVSTSAGMPADGVVLPGDTVIALNDVPVSSIDELRSALQDAGSVNPVDITVIRDGATVVTTLTPVTKEGTTLIGLVGQTEYKYPFEVTISLNDVGGPSAGLMFALGIVDMVTPGGMTGGKNFAGTGTIDADGNVGPIGGIRQKLYSALAAQAPYFLAPLDNCDEVVGNVPEGLQVFAVATITEAVTAVSTVASGSDAAISELPTCR
jgi:PDZ domain-containing protein